MKLLNFTIIKLTLCFCVGIIIAFHLPISLYLSIISSLGLLFLLILSFTISKYQFNKNVWFGIIAFLTTINLGVLVFNFHQQTNFKNHYSHHITKYQDSKKLITFRIREQLKPSLFHDKYMVDILAMDKTSVVGKSLLNISKDSSSTKLNIDAVFITKSSFQDIAQPLNPNQFNYKSYLEKQYVYHQIFIENINLKPVASKPHTVFGYAHNLRRTINSKLKEHDFTSEELSVINALLLGQRKDISEELYNNYINAGAVHILAVSGLHIGIILLLLSWVLRPIEYFKHGKLIKVLLLLILLWSFAIIAGLSASVTRAVAMFSIVAIAMHWKRPTNIYNTLGISVLLILLFKPMFLFDVGFQLSYIAVLAIVSIQPFIYKLWKPKFKILDYFWQIFTVTIAAQIGVVPISLYYFHQFPSLFFISNLAIIPFLGLILGLGIIVIFLALFNCLPEFIAQLYGTMISSMNNLVDWVAKQEQFLFKDVSFSMLQMLTIYLFIILIVQFYKTKSYLYLRFSFMALLVIQSAFIFIKYESSKNEFIVFHKSRQTLIGEKTGNHLTLFTSNDSLTLDDIMIKNYSVGNSIKSSNKSRMKSVYTFKDKTFLIVDSMGIYNVKSFKPDIVILRNSPKINLERLIDSVQPQLIIADGSNYKSYAELWKATCYKLKHPFHQTSEKGAYILR
ncbi:ComEC/Rec2 family competence protein [Geojedonia litorea]|uniref:ComEC/Rec2 family competence protein n=1 Tax=Geojedonia litorea TaxID=1268269 RepID=A0ABV9N762_9FLAO